jgi:hypothetical protein
MIYLATGNAPLCVWALVGEGQLGAVALNSVLGAPDGNGNFYWALGLAEPLKGSAMLVDATFLALNPHSQSASLTLVLYQLIPGQPDLPPHRFNEMTFLRQSLTFGAGMALAYSDLIQVQ